VLRLFRRAFMGVMKLQVNRFALDLQPLIDQGHLRDWEEACADGFQCPDFVQGFRCWKIAVFCKLFSAPQQPLAHVEARLP